MDALVSVGHSSMMKRAALRSIRPWVTGRRRRCSLLRRQGVAKRAALQYLQPPVPGRCNYSSSSETAWQRKKRAALCTIYTVAGRRPLWRTCILHRQALGDEACHAAIYGRLSPVDETNTLVFVGNRFVRQHAALPSIRLLVTGRRAQRFLFFVDKGLVTKRAALQSIQPPVSVRCDYSSLVATA